VTPELAATLKNLPDRPGVYLMRDARREVVYVGKAQSLRNRVRSYWQKQAIAPLEGHRIRNVVDRIVDVEYTITDSVSEALLLEANLIKRYRPRFNVRLKDDKSYPYIKVTLADDFPRIERTRKLVEDGSRYFGPYASATSVDESMNLVRRLFPFRTCTIEIKDGERALPRPCLLYHIKRCQGPCIEAVSKADYRAQIDQIELFLEGRQEIVAKALTTEMRAASERTDYEQAAVLRDKVRAIERTMESQKMAAFRRTELDLVGLARQDNQAAIQLFAIRDGKAIGRDVFLLDAAHEAPDEEVLSSFLEQFYARATSIPRQVLVPFQLAEGSDLEAFLSGRRGGPVHLLVPQRGERRELMALATRNAAETLAREQARWLPTRARRWRRSRSWRRRWSCPGRRSGSSATTSRTSRGPIRSAAWSCSRRASRGRASIAGSRSGRSSGRTTSPRTRRSCGDGSGGPGTGRRARPRSSAGRCPTS